MQKLVPDAFVPLLVGRLYLFVVPVKQLEPRAVPHGEVIQHDLIVMKMLVVVHSEKQLPFQAACFRRGALQQRGHQLLGEGIRFYGEHRAFAAAVVMAVPELFLTPASRGRLPVPFASWPIPAAGTGPFPKSSHDVLSCGLWLPFLRRLSGPWRLGEALVPCFPAAAAIAVPCCGFGRGGAVGGKRPAVFDGAGMGLLPKRRPVPVPRQAAAFLPCRQLNSYRFGFCRRNRASRRHDTGMRRENWAL